MTSVHVRFADGLIAKRGDGTPGSGLRHLVPILEDHNAQVLVGLMTGSPSMSRVTQANDDALKAGHDEHWWIRLVC